MVPARKPATIEITKVPEPKIRRWESKARLSSPAALLFDHLPIRVDQLDVPEPKFPKPRFNLRAIAHDHPNQVLRLHYPLGRLVNVIQFEGQHFVREGFEIILRQAK